MQVLIGSYECKVDAKCRLPMPAPFRKQLEPLLHEGFVLKRSVFQPCLELYTMQEWNKLMGKLNTLNPFVKKNNDFIRKFTAGVKLIEPDANGRIQIAKDLVVFANIKKEVVVCAAVNIIEIWDKQLYEQTIDFDSNEFATIAEELLGKDEQQLP